MIQPSKDSYRYSNINEILGQSRETSQSSRSLDKKMELLGSSSSYSSTAASTPHPSVISKDSTQYGKLLQEKVNLDTLLNSTKDTRTIARQSTHSTVELDNKYTSSLKQPTSFTNSNHISSNSNSENYYSGSLSSMNTTTSLPMNKQQQLTEKTNTLTGPMYSTKPSIVPQYPQAISSSTYNSSISDTKPASVASETPVTYTKRILKDLSNSLYPSGNEATGGSNDVVKKTLNYNMDPSDSDDYLKSSGVETPVSKRTVDSRSMLTANQQPIINIEASAIRPTTSSIRKSFGQLSDTSFFSGENTTGKKLYALLIWESKVTSFLVFTFGCFLFTLQLLGYSLLTLFASALWVSIVIFSVLSQAKNFVDGVKRLFFDRSGQTTGSVDELLNRSSANGDHLNTRDLVEFILESGNAAVGFFLEIATCTNFRHTMMSLIGLGCLIYFSKVTSWTLLFLVAWVVAFVYPVLTSPEHLCMMQTHLVNLFWWILQLIPRILRLVTGIGSSKTSSPTNNNNNNNNNKKQQSMSLSSSSSLSTKATQQEMPPPSLATTATLLNKNKLN